MDLYERLIRPMMFSLDAETAHNLGMSAIRHGAVGSRIFQDSSLEQILFGVKFNNPLGLAPGFDKNALAVDQWHKLGFGFAEIGTVTYHPQPGNPKPRIFRLPEDKAVINRLGFNNDGAEAISRHLDKAQPQIPIGINLGKSKVCELANAAQDYQESFRLLHSFGDYFVVNVSSPNTPGLRSLQERGPLLEIIAAIREVDSSKPLFVKIAPDLEFPAIDEIVDVATQSQLTGLIATNTTIGRNHLRSNAEETGGLSGMPLQERSNEVLSYLADHCEPNLILIGVGGIFTGRDLFEKIGRGAHLCQVYTGFIYGGPKMPSKCLKELHELMNRAGITSLGKLRGNRSALQWLYDQVS